MILIEPQMSFKVVTSATWTLQKVADIEAEKISS